MSSLASLVVILFLTVLAPLIIVLHFVTRWKQARVISRDDEQMLEELYAHSQRIDDRLHTLERIFDQDRPEWRKKI